MARNTPPSLVSYTETASWITNGASKSTSASVAWQTGDILVFIGGGQDVGTIGVPTATGLTFTSRALNTTPDCQSRGATAVAASTSSAVISATNSVSTQHWGFGVWVWRGSDGFDAAGEQHTSTKTKAIVHTDTHSATCWGVFDFAATAVAGISLTPAASHTRQAAADGTAYTFYAGDLVDQAASGSVSYGITGGSGTGPFSIAAVAVLGTTVGASTVKPLTTLGVG